MGLWFLSDWLHSKLWGLLNLPENFHFIWQSPPHPMPTEPLYPSLRWLVVQGGLKLGEWFLFLVSALWFFGVRLRRAECRPIFDRLLGIRVVVDPDWKRRRRIPEALRSESVDALTYAECWGPIRVGPVLENGLRLGLDPVLRRQVLLEQRRSDARVLEARKMCARAGRLRWLQSVRDLEGGVWEVWQAPSGSPLTELMKQGEVEWPEVIDWMSQLAREASEAVQEGTLPQALGIEHVWITADHRAVLLDFAWKKSPCLLDAGRPSGERDSLRELQSLLFELAQWCPAWRRPLHADDFLGSLRKASVERFTHLLGWLEVLRNKKPVMPHRLRQSVAVLLFLLPPLASALNGYLENTQSANHWALAFPGIPPLPIVMSEMGGFLHATPEAEEEKRGTTKGHVSFGFAFRSSTPLPYVPHPTCILRVYPEPSPVGEALGTHLRGHYASLFSNPEKGFKEFLDEKELKLSPAHQEDVQCVVESVQDQPPVEADALADADRAVRDYLEHPERWFGIPLSLRMQDLLFGLFLSFEAVAVAAALGQLICILMLGVPLLMRLTGVAFVTRTARPAGRLILVGRWALGWLPMLGIQYPVLLWAFALMQAGAPTMVVVLAPWMVLLAGGISVFFTERSPLDRFTGTWRVTR